VFRIRRSNKEYKLHSALGFEFSAPIVGLSIPSIDWSGDIAKTIMCLVAIPIVISVIHLGYIILKSDRDQTWRQNITLSRNLLIGGSTLPRSDDNFYEKLEGQARDVVRHFYTMDPISNAWALRANGKVLSPDQKMRYWDAVNDADEKGMWEPNGFYLNKQSKVCLLGQTSPAGASPALIAVIRKNDRGPDLYRHIF
jgi:hypothetical protein